MIAIGIFLIVRRHGKVEHPENKWLFRKVGNQKKQATDKKEKTKKK